MYKYVDASHKYIREYYTFVMCGRKFVTHAKTFCFYIEKIVFDFFNWYIWGVRIDSLRAALTKMLV
jgi:hypothetical protein